MQVVCSTKGHAVHTTDELSATITAGTFVLSRQNKTLRNTKFSQIVRVKEPMLSILWYLMKHAGIRCPSGEILRHLQTKQITLTPEQLRSAIRTLRANVQGTGAHQTGCVRGNLDDGYMFDETNMKGISLAPRSVDY